MLQSIEDAEVTAGEIVVWIDFEEKLIETEDLDDLIENTVFFCWFSSVVNCISLFFKTISYLRHFDN
jgi:hypothetical protein